MPFCKRIPFYRERVEQSLDQWLPKPDGLAAPLHEAMRYSVLGGGKRIRPLLVYATGEVLGIDANLLDAPACSIECIHAYSLIHDDLPAMDDDELRRGKPTTHRAFDEATAILAGDTLQALAFRILAEDSELMSADIDQIGLVKVLTHAAGADGLTGGQIIDLGAERKRLTPEQIEDMFFRKTAILIRAGILMACHCAKNPGPGVRDALSDFGRDIGLAFQIRDDILDVEGSTEVIGKPQGSDDERGKSSYPAIMGLDASKGRATELYDSAMSRLDRFGESAEPLRYMGDYIVNRNQ